MPQQSSTQKDIRQSRRPTTDFCSVFLPAAGNCNNGNVNDQGNNGNYWSSTPNGSNNAYNLNFNSGNQNVNNNNRNNGYSVRAVLAEHLSDKTILIVI